MKTDGLKITWFGLHSHNIAYPSQ